MNSRLTLSDRGHWNPLKIVGTYDGQNSKASEPVKFFNSQAWPLSTVPAGRIGVTLGRCG